MSEPGTVSNGDGALTSPGSPGAAPRASGRRPGRRGITLAIAALFVVALSSLAIVDIGYDRTEPLARGSFASTLQVCAAGVEMPDCQPVSSPTLYPGARFQYARTIRNEGAAPITILGLDLPRRTAIEWLPPAITKPDHLYLQGPDDITDLVPMTLAPGAELSIVVRGRVRDCAPPPSQDDAIILDTLEVGYRLLVVEHTGQIADDEPLVIPFGPCLGAT